MSTVIPYTAIVGNYPPRPDVKCFGNRELFRSNVMEAKIYKVLAHLFMECDYSIWMDANIYLNAEPEAIVEALLGDNDIALFMHPWRKRWDEESFFIQCWGKTRDNIMITRYLAEQETHYKARGLGEKVRLHECGIIIRRHNDRVKAFNNTWWAEICRWHERDQVTFPIAAETCGVELKLRTIPQDHRESKYFKY